MGTYTTWINTKKDTNYFIWIKISQVVNPGKDLIHSLFQRVNIIYLYFK